MAVVGRTTTKWLNADGLLVAFGKDEAVVATVGEYATMGNGGRHVVEIVIDLTALELTDEKILDDSVTIPAGAFIEQVDVLVTEESTTSSGTFDIGLVDQDRSTEIDFDGLVINLASPGDGTDLGELTTIVKGSTGAGALIGTQLTNTGLITGSADTAVFTDGVVKLKVYYHIPLSADL